MSWASGDVVPPLLPARMLNEYTYCPRLFHLEWVAQQWADNDDTEEGRFHHRRADVAVDGPLLAAVVHETRARRSAGRRGSGRQHGGPG